MFECASSILIGRSLIPTLLRIGPSLAILELAVVQLAVEPTSNLDVRHQLDVTRMLKELTEQKRILTIMISHDISITAKYSDEILMMSEGKIYAYGTPSEVITEDNLSAVYGVKSKIIDDDSRPHVILKDAFRISETVPGKNTASAAE